MGDRIPFREADAASVSTEVRRRLVSRHEPYPIWTALEQQGGMLTWLPLAGERRLAAWTVALREGERLLGVLGSRLGRSPERWRAFPSALRAVANAAGRRRVLFADPTPLTPWLARGLRRGARAGDGSDRHDTAEG